MINLLFYVFLFLLIAPFAGYIFLLIPLRKKKGTKAHPAIDITGISVIIPCYNEEENIERKIKEILALCATIRIINFELILISDGSTDATNEILQKHASIIDIKIFILNERVGKASALNFGVLQSQYDMLIFSDVRQIIKRDCFKVLLSHFSDPDVGAVTSRLEHADSSQIRNIINHLKFLENKFGSTIGVYGALYAIKKANYIPIPANTILDDLLISLNVINQGKLVKIEAKALVFDIAFEKFYNKKRTLRLISGLLQIAFVHTKLILSLSYKNIFLLFFQKYFKLILPVISIALPLLAYLSDGFSSLKFQSVCFIWAASAILILFGKKGLSIRFTIKMIYFYIISFLPTGKKETVLWDK